MRSLSVPTCGYLAFDLNPRRWRQAAIPATKGLVDMPGKQEASVLWFGRLPPIHRASHSAITGASGKGIIFGHPEPMISRTFATASSIVIVLTEEKSQILIAALHGGGRNLNRLGS